MTPESLAKLKVKKKFNKNNNAVYTNYFINFLLLHDHREK